MESVILNEVKDLLFAASAKKSKSFHSRMAPVFWTSPEIAQHESFIKLGQA